MEGGFEPVDAATAMSWAIYGLVQRWFYEKRKQKISASQFADQILPLITPKSEWEYIPRP